MAEYFILQSNIEKSIMFSKLHGLRIDLRSGLCEPRDNSLAELFSAKNIIRSQQQAEIEKAIRILFIPNKAKNYIYSLQQQKYDKTNRSHEEKLLKLWSILMPNEALTGLISPQWRILRLYKK